MKSIKTYIKRKLDNKVSVRRTLKIAAFAAIIGAAGTTYLNITVVPQVVQAYEDMTTTTVTNNAPFKEEAPVESSDRLDQYFQAAYDENESKFNQLREDDAMRQAIEKMEADLEAEKEELRERELFL